MTCVCENPRCTEKPCNRTCLVIVQLAFACVRLFDWHSGFLKCTITMSATVFPRLKVPSDDTSCTCTTARLTGTSSCQTPSTFATTEHDSVIGGCAHSRAAMRFLFEDETRNVGHVNRGLTLRTRTTMRPLQTCERYTSYTQNTVKRYVGARTDNRNSNGYGGSPANSELPFTM